MGTGGRLIGSVLWLAALGFAFDARAAEGGPLLVFDASAQGLPQEEVRAAVEKELGGPLATSSAQASGELTILVDAERRIVVRYRAPAGTVERSLPMPKEPGDVPLIVSLAAGNLVRDQATGVEPAKRAPETETKPVAPATAPAASAPTQTPQRAAPPKRPPPTELKRHWLGLHFAQDIAFVYGSSVCHQQFGPADDFACFYEGSDDPFFHQSQVDTEDLDEGPTFATNRVLLSYDFAIVPQVTVGVRLGYAFNGGPPAGQAPQMDPPEGNLNLLPASTGGSNGSAFLPVHAEIRGSYWYLPLTGRSIGAYVGGGFGLAQVDSQHSVGVYDCAQTLADEWDPAGGDFDDCVRKTQAMPLESTQLDAWKKMGRGFATVTTGAMFPVKGDTSLVMNLNAMLMFPSEGFVLEPSLGLMTWL